LQDIPHLRKNKLCAEAHFTLPRMSTHPFCPVLSDVKTHLILVKIVLFYLKYIMAG
jgi:hypothetical protein